MVTELDKKVARFVKKEELLARRKTAVTAIEGKNTLKSETPRVMNLKNSRS